MGKARIFDFACVWVRIPVWDQGSPQSRYHPEGKLFLGVVVMRKEGKARVGAGRGASADDDDGNENE